MREEIKNLINEALKNLDIKETDFVVEHPEDFKNGDYSSNVSMISNVSMKIFPKLITGFKPSDIEQKKKLFGGEITGERSGNPRELANVIKHEIEKRLPKEIEKVEVAGPGFINFYLTREFFRNSIKEICEKGENFGKNEKLKGQKTMCEYTDPNPFKEFHIGHLMSNTIGESISRIVEANGAEVKRACYQGDVGMHAAKAVWGFQKQKDWKTAYAFGSKSYEESEETKKEVLEINKKLYDRSDSELNKIYDQGKKESLDEFEKIYKKLGTKFNFYFFESETGTLGKKIVEENTGKVFEKGEKDAIVFRAEKFNKNLHTRVFVNSEGLPTYEAKELGLAEIKYEKYPYDESIVITGNEINAYFNVLLEAMKQVFPKLAEKTKHISHGMLRLPTGKMSSRTGDVITGESLFSIISGKVIGKVKETNRGEMSEEFINQVSVAALKYSILKQAIGGDIIYDFDKSISFEGDSGPYLQYSYARAKSVKKKAEDEGISKSFENVPDEISEPEKIMYRFTEVVERSGEEFAPHYIVNYLIELARSFNAYYGNTKIANKEDSASSYRVALAEAFSIVVKNGLHLLGIEAPEKM